MSILQTIIQASDLFFEVVSNRENLDLKSEIGETLYNANYRKRVIIPSSVTIGSLSTGQAALKIPTGAGGEIVIDNYGAIQGAGGPAGNDGGDAILAQSNCRINNKPTGTIYAGGGGGGIGGTGGTGGSGYTVSHPSFPCPIVYQASGVCSGPVQNPTSGGAGGSGGNGGRGRGYDGALTSGSAGASGSAGGANAGTGGDGGAGGSGGDWGQPGSSGSSGLTGSNGNVTNGLIGSAGSAGGAAGNYINGLSSYVTFTNNGTVAGGTN